MISTDSITGIGRRGALAVIAMLVAACSGGSGDSAGGSPQSTNCVANGARNDCGTVLVAVTDAEGDFISYTVDVLSISLTRENGGTVETLPAATRIDFAQLTELADLVSAAAVVPGDIVGGTIVLDYTDAEVFVEAGGEIVPAEVVGPDGNPLGIVDVEIRLADRDRLVVTRGRTAFLGIDFDLAVSHDVDTSASPVSVTARPYLVAEIDPLDEKDLRVRGALVGVDVAAATYDVRVRPWFSRIGDHGVVTVHTTGATSFEIDDATYAGQAGLEALAELEPGTLTVAFGTLDLEQRVFTAEIVTAGDSLGGDRYSAVHGNIVARTADRLVLKGAFAVRRDRAAHFHRTVIVTVGPDTSVVKAGEPDAAVGPGDLSVGQRIVAIGQLADGVASTDPFGPDVAMTLDATEGRVRMLVTRLYGNVTSVVPGQINLSLRGIDRLPVDLFDFAGTGNADDADPTDYEVATATLSLGAIEVGRPARIFGFVAPFGAAPPDFSALTVVGPRDIPAALGIGWGVEGTLAPFSSMSGAGLVPDLDNVDIGERHHLLLGRELVDLLDLPGPPTVTPADGGLYGIWEPEHIELFGDFGAFVDAIGARLSDTGRARSLHAEGRYDESGILVESRRVVVHLLPAD